jgi:hypothetical protein
MTLEECFLLVRRAVKHTGVIEQNHIDLSVVPASERSRYEAALVQIQMAVKANEISKEEMLRRLGLS